MIMTASVEEDALRGHGFGTGPEVNIFAAYPRAQAKERYTELQAMITDGRLLISEKNARVLPTDDQIDFQID